MSQSASVDRSAIAELVLAVLREVIAQNDQPVPADLSEVTALIGRSTVLDSLGMVTMIVEVEQQIEGRFGVRLALADDRAMSQKNSPFRTVQTFTDHIVMLMAEGGANG
jgi:acyl carrier protein